jgi:hypothetical protein
VRGNQPVQLHNHNTNTAREEQVDQNHTEGRQLRGDRDEVEAGLHAPLVLGDSVRHGNNQCTKEEKGTQVQRPVDRLIQR